MLVEQALDVFREAFWMVIVMVAIIVVPGLLLGLVVSMFQAATQINEQTLSFLPRLLLTIAAVMFFGSYLLSMIMDFTITLFTNLPNYIA